MCIFFLGIAVAFFVSRSFHEESLPRIPDATANPQAWYKIRTAPSPFTFALVFACVLADVSSLLRLSYADPGLTGPLSGVSYDRTAVPYSILHVWTAIHAGKCALPARKTIG